MGWRSWGFATLHPRAGSPAGQPGWAARLYAIGRVRPLFVFNGCLSHLLDFTYDSAFVESRSANKMSKYRQRGYMDSDRESQRPKSQSKPQSKPQDRDGPRSPRMMAFGEASKCTACGAKSPANINVDSSCPKCNADLHSCRQCTHFDPGARLECNKPIPARIVNKHARNECELFATRIVVERETSSGPPTDARDAFAKLFKK